MIVASKSPLLSFRRMKDDVWSYLFAFVFLGEFGLGVIGLRASAWLPFIPSEAAESAARYWIPAIVTLAFIVMLAMHKAGAGPRRLIELWRYYGAAVTSAMVIVCAAMVFSLCFLAGDAGVAKSFAVITKYLPFVNSRLEAKIVSTHDFSRTNHDMQWVHINVAGQINRQTEFAYPAVSLAAMHCADAGLLIDGDLSWAGLLVRQVECISGHDQ